MMDAVQTELRQKELMKLLSQLPQNTNRSTRRQVLWITRELRELGTADWEEVLLKYGKHIGLPSQVIKEMEIKILDGDI